MVAAVAEAMAAVAAVAVDAVVTAAVVVVVVETASLAGKDRSKLTITTAPLEHRVDAPGALAFEDAALNTEPGAVATGCWTQLL